MHGLLRHRVTDVLRLDRERVAGADTRKTALGVHVIGDEFWTIQLLEGLAEDRPWTGGTALHERLKSFALRGVRPVVDERGRHTVSFVDRGRPVRVETDAEAVELHVAVDPLLELPRPPALALAGRWAAVHVAGASVLAVACDDQGSLHVPRGRLCVSHPLAPSHRPANTHRELRECEDDHRGDDK